MSNHPSPADPSAEAEYNRGVTFHSAERFTEAVECYRRAIALRPNLGEAHNNLGTALQRLGRIDEALACFQRAKELLADSPDVSNNLGMVLHAMGRWEAAAESYRQALARRPDLPEALNNLGHTLQKMGRAEESLDCFRQAMRLRPDSPGIVNNLGNVLKELGRLDEAIACYDRALGLRPAYPEALNNLGNALKDSGRLDLALAAYDQALELRPDYAVAHSGRVYTLHFHPDYDTAAIFQEHVRWNQRHARPLARFIQPHDNDPSPHRRLRIGYVSADLYDHVIGRFMLPLLANHNEFEIFCYASVACPDAMTERLRGYADVWRGVVGLNDEQLADLIRQDRIDILVDLTMHMGSSRLLAFARKPAPVQVTYLAYCGTTGLEAMDYRLTDPYLDPMDTTPTQEATRLPNYSEQSVHLPRTWWCYRPPEDVPEVGPLPAVEAGRVTFGCLNNFCKITSPTWDAWGQLLQAVPSARLMVHACEGTHRQQARDRLAQAGVDPARLEFAGFQPLAQYFHRYGEIDIALDPFPYTGGTTTCDALWMGVPVVSLAGRTAVSRGGLSILTNVGLGEWVARSPQEYVRMAAQLAGDLPRLQQLRQTLRERMKRSPLMDERSFATDMEAAYRRMWQTWCAARECSEYS
jgi:predicted O-linked N-acetylglucosamine transferase (SPINDLY family)